MARFILVFFLRLFLFPALQEKKAAVNGETPHHDQQPAFETPLSLDVPQKHREAFQQNNGYHQNHQNLLTVVQPPMTGRETISSR